MASFWGLDLERNAPRAPGERVLDSKDAATQNPRGLCCRNGRPVLYPGGTVRVIALSGLPSSL